MGIRIRDDIYDILKWGCMLCLPSLATLASTIGAIWSIPVLEPISKTIVAINAALAMMLGISSIGYWQEGGNDEDSACG